MEHFFSALAFAGLIAAQFLAVVSVSGSRECSRRSQPGMARLPVLPIRSRAPWALTAASRAAVTSALISARIGRARESTARPSGVGMLPVRSRVNSSPPMVFSIRRS